MSEAVAAYHNVAASPEFQELERMRDKASHDEASALRNARLKAEKARSREIAIKLLAKKMSVVDVAETTNLTVKEVEKLRDAK